MSTTAQVGTGHYRTQAHLSHVPSHSFVVDEQPFSVQLSGDASDAVEGVSRVDFVYAPLECQLLRRGKQGLVVQAASVQPKQLGLSTNGQTLRIGDQQLPVHQGRSLRPIHRFDQLFFPTTPTEWLAY